MKYRGQVGFVGASCTVCEHLEDVTSTLFLFALITVSGLIWYARLKPLGAPTHFARMLIRSEQVLPLVFKERSLLIPRFVLEWVTEATI